MSLFKRFSKSLSVTSTPPKAKFSTNSSKSSSPQDALQVLHDKVENVERRIAFIEKKSKEKLQEAKLKKTKGDKKGALLALKIRKMYETEITKLQNVIMLFQTQIIALESSTTNNDIFDGMNTGKVALESMKKKMDIDKVQDLQDDIREGMEDANQMNDLLSTDTGVYGNMDDDELLKDLEESMERELEGTLDDDLLKATKSAVAPKKKMDSEIDLDLDLPKAPTKAVTASTSNKSVTASSPAKMDVEEEEEAIFAALERELKIR